MTECQSTRGKWSPEKGPLRRCPDCRAPMPRDIPIRNWMSQRHIDRATSENATATVNAVFVGKTAA
jgi:ribosomal protein S26